MYKNTLKITFVSFIAILALVNCPKEKKDDNTAAIALLALSSQPKSTAEIVAASYPNQTTGTSASIQASNSSSSAVSSVSSSVSSNVPATSIRELIDSIAKDTVAKARQTTQSTCNGTDITETKKYQTATTVSSASFLLSGSYKVTPNLTLTGTTNCSNSQGTSTTFDSTKDYSAKISNKVTTSGSITIAFSSAKIKVLDIEGYVKNKTFTWKEVILNGTVTVKNLSNNTSQVMNATYTGSSKTTNITNTLSITSSSESSSSDFSVDNGEKLEYSLKSSITGEVSQSTTSKSSISCTNSYSVVSGEKVEGTVNGSAVSASYNLNTEDFKKLYKAQNGTDLNITMCSAAASTK